MRTRVTASRSVSRGLLAALAAAGLAAVLAVPQGTAGASVRTVAEDRPVLPPFVTFPVAASGSPADRATFVRGRHNGTDIAAACGTPVLAAIPGTVRVMPNQKWAGGTLVKVFTTRNRLTTWYAYLQDVTVTDGQIVQAGQALGTVGDGGGATACELGFQVRNDAGATIRNPSPWLDRNVGLPVPASLVFGNRGFNLATMNVLGASHTKRPGGDAGSRYPTYDVRLPKAIRAIEDRNIDVIGFQEFQKPQHEMFQRRAGSEYQVYPATRDMDTENSIAWKRSSFDLVSADRFDVTYFNGSTRKMPYVLLRQKSTGLTAYFINVHNPANTYKYHHQEKYRAKAIAAERALVISLRASGRPVFLTGDLNDREAAFCPLTAGKLMLTPNSVPSMDCAPPAKLWIDWIFGAGPTRFATYSVDWTVKDKNITDHPIVFTRAHLAD